MCSSQTSSVVLVSGSVEDAADVSIKTETSAIVVATEDLIVTRLCVQGISSIPVFVRYLASEADEL